MDMKKSVKSIASKGRYGDTELLHVNKRELAGLASLMPGGKLTKNPDTGLPEAFFFLLPFLSGLGAAAAPAAAATAAGAGLAAEAAAATAAASTAAAAAAPALAASALPAAASGLGAASAAAPILGAEAAAAALPAVTGAAAPAMSGLSALAEGSAALPAAAAAASPATMAASALPAAAGVEAAAAPAMSAGLSSLAEASAAVPAAEGGLGAMLGGLDLSQLSQLAPLAMMMPGGGGEKEKKPKRDISGIKYGGGEVEMPGDVSEYGTDGGEFDFFPDEDRGYAEGGMVSAPGDKEIIMAATQALLGQSPDPDGALMLFIKTFGEAALQDLAQRVKQMSAQSAPAGRFVQGPGTGTSDSVPTVIDGRTPAALSDGEFVVPADVVAGMGGGNPKQGADQLYGMMENVRKLANGGLVKRFAQGGTVTPFQQGLMSVIGNLG